MRRALALALLLSPSPAAAKPRVRVYARSKRPGEAMLVVVTGEGRRRAPSGAWAGEALPFYACTPTTYLALAGIDLELSTGTHRLDLTLTDARGRSKGWSRELRVTPRRFATRELHVPEQYVSPAPAQEARANRETKRILDVFARVTPRPWMTGDFRMPVRGARTTSRFGERSVFNGRPRSPHSGADIHASTGTRVLAPQDGVVALADDYFFPGGTVVVDHGLGVYSLLAHLSRIRVKPGRRVRRGQTLGLAGATGRVTGPHVHWAVKVLGARVDPISVMALPLGRWLRRCAPAPKARASQNRTRR